MLGHSSAAMTLDVYADLFDDDLDTLASALNDARSKSQSMHGKSATSEVRELFV